MSETALTTFDDSNNTNLMVDLTAPTDQYCSLIPKTDKDRADLYNLMNTPQHRLKDMINMELTITDVYCEMVSLVNQETGAIEKAPRIVLIDDKREGYACVSYGIFSSLKKLFAVVGQPSWPKGIKIRIKQISKSADRNVLTIQLV